AIPAIFSVISALGAVANALAVCVLGHASASRTTVANMFMLNLCVSDLLFLLSLPLWAVYYSLGYSWTFGRLTCKLCGALLNFNLYASIFFITSMSVDRYLAIVHPLRSQNSRNPRRARFVCLLVWVLACACSSPSLYLRDTYYIEELAVEACAIIYPNHTWYLTLVLMKIILAFLLPLIIISCCYCAIGRHLIAGSSKSLEGRRLEKVLWTVAAVVMAFFLCWFPFHCVTFLDLLRSEGWLDSCWVNWTIRNLTPLTLSLGFSNSAINPVLYCFVGNHFRGRLGGLCKSFCACLKAPGEDHGPKRGSFSTRLSSFSQ
uniref:Angiotensin II receptor, type 2 n=1 Tax=Tetraodon nigroviridis TaxID=99883 RepID=H3DEB2_TETNG